jgi:hypothetical protein
MRPEPEEARRQRYNPFGNGTNEARSCSLLWTGKVVERGCELHAVSALRPSPNDQAGQQQFECEFLHYARLRRGRLAPPLDLLGIMHPETVFVLISIRNPGSARLTIR